MKKIFVAGAGGYIGEGVAVAFRRAGYKVYGLVRNQSKVPSLLKYEIIPVVARIEDVDSYKDILIKCSVIIDAVGMGDFSDGFLNATNEAFSQINVNESEKPLYIFTSGIMTYGNASTGPLDETMEAKPTHQWTEDRKNFENKVFNFGKNEQAWIRTVFVRPGFVYGRSGGPIANIFFGISKESDLVLYGSPNKRWSWVHVDDLGDGYVLIVENSKSTPDNQIFNLSNVDNPTYHELRVGMAKAAGWNEKKYKVEYREIPPDNRAVLVWENTVIINPHKAKEIGWNPKHENFVSEIDIYYESWLAYRNDN